MDSAPVATFWESSPGALVCTYPVLFHPLRRRSPRIKLRVLFSAPTPTTRDLAAGLLVVLGAGCWYPSVTSLAPPVPERVIPPGPIMLRMLSYQISPCRRIDFNWYNHSYNYSRRSGCLLGKEGGQVHAEVSTTNLKRLSPLPWSNVNVDTVSFSCQLSALFSPSSLLDASWHHWESSDSALPPKRDFDMYRLVLCPFGRPPQRSLPSILFSRAFHVDALPLRDSPPILAIPPFLLFPPLPPSSSRSLESDCPMAMANLLDAGVTGACPHGHGRQGANDAAHRAGVHLPFGRLGRRASTNDAAQPGWKSMMLMIRDPAGGCAAAYRAGVLSWTANEERKEGAYIDGGGGLLESSPC